MTLASDLRFTSNFTLCSNLLLPTATSQEPSNVKYLINIFNGEFVAKTDYILQISFGSTRVSFRTFDYYYLHFSSSADANEASDLLKALSVE